ncbi:phosphoadenosine phosphosulfate reductase [Elizabethkingia anophelis]|uniref:phosphoadenosine phosphosulfate reductase domain-containing protein n=1 Tax=Elizabethkingia anophelis TaxID=1117645 RepID=UPI0009954291|nr:phosphoadenosine phosphosulfate reductase family protein [Elizabethkingia anophelis]AQW96661.1 phosphoadenosine phosphosulfate reductase [Elizabethkingia anophelis]MDV3673656.1 phosphoadenosine phosphosulfate reductase [Elizabethkingia anophelis]MDV3692380.1 phosphoadenosine phosphosulfate reductase [Elizabethkingia anophelis]MDV3706661.1 phosphoadenosine phosphosulfate reductase [Elizabethkingia anophelis]OPB50089.1 phosphoadenosine phosphosulfate reductase [Elizabethkingia anophelis]
MNLLTPTMNSIKALSEKTDRVLLFHSAAGKDSIALLEMLAPHFKFIQCVFMYMVKDLDHINRYIKWAEKRYPNCQFIQTPHYAYYNLKKHGFYGAEQVGYSDWTLSKIADKVVEETGIEWQVYGFKKADSMTRNIMLKGYYDEITNEKTKKIYPLSRWKNKEVLAYIEKQRLIKPLQYSKLGNAKSQGTAVDDIGFLMWCKNNAPEDLKKVIAEFPDAERIIFEYEYQEKRKND